MAKRPERRRGTGAKTEATRQRTAAFLRGVAADPLRALFLGLGGVEPSAALHSLAEDPE